MRQKVILILAVIGLIALLVGLNALSYSQEPETPDSELEPNRSTFNSGETGTQAFYTLLAESGRKVVRWQEPTASLLPYVESRPATFVAIGPFRRSFTEAETSELLSWVSSGGNLVLIDRSPPPELVTTTVNWKLQIYRPATTLRPDETTAKPVQPTLFSAGVNSARLSEWAGMVTMSRSEDPAYAAVTTGEPPPPSAPEPSPDVYTVSPVDADTDPEYGSYTGEEIEQPTPYDFSGTRSDTNTDFSQPPPPMVNSNAAVIAQEEDDEEVPRTFEAPIVHLRTNERDVLVEVPYGEGRIVYLADPFVVSNSGIKELDNAQLAINITGANTGLVAFDEYHQGFGSNNNRLLEYFSGTPVVAMFLQLILVVGLVLFSQSRRFARAVPEPEPDRLSKLEYVSAMAELQQRTKAFDLAIENIYLDFRRRVSRLLGGDAMRIKHTELSKLIAERLGENIESIENVLFDCEDAIRGEPINKRRTVHLIAELRNIEQKLGMRRSARDGFKRS